MKAIFSQKQAKTCGSMMAHLILSDIHQADVCSLYTLLF